MTSEASFQAQVAGLLRCAGRLDLDWVPVDESGVVPQEMRSLCWDCPGQSHCLQRAVETGSHGYWAATTTADRDQLRQEGVVSVHRAKQIVATRQAEASAQAEPEPKHPPGEESLWWYRRGGCHCTGCRACNAADRAQERARARAKSAAAADVAA
jgi:hypothetical protein